MYNDVDTQNREGMCNDDAREKMMVLSSTLQVSGLCFRNAGEKKN